MTETGGYSGFFPQQVLIESYGRGGFRFAGMSHRGSILCLPSGIYAWHDEDDPGSRFGAVLSEAAKIELLMVGAGEMPVPFDETTQAMFDEAGLMAESMATGAAVRTYNVLLGDGRPVAAALKAVD